MALEGQVSAATELSKNGSLLLPLPCISQYDEQHPKHCWRPETWEYSVAIKKSNESEWISFMFSLYQWNWRAVGISNSPSEHVRSFSYTLAYSPSYMVFLALIICCWVLALLLSDTDGWVCGVCLHPGRPTPRAQSNEWNIISSITAFVLLSPSCLNSETRIISTEAWGFYLSAVLFFLGGCFFFFLCSLFCMAAPALFCSPHLQFVCFPGCPLGKKKI